MNLTKEQRKTISFWLFVAAIGCFMFGWPWLGGVVLAGALAI